MFLAQFGSGYIICAKFNTTLLLLGGDLLSIWNTSDFFLHTFLECGLYELSFFGDCEVLDALSSLKKYFYACDRACVLEREPTYSYTFFHSLPYNDNAVKNF